MMIRCAAGAEGARLAQRAWRISLHLIRFSPFNLISNPRHELRRVFGPAWGAVPIAGDPDGGARMPRIMAPPNPD